MEKIRPMADSAGQFGQAVGSFVFQRPPTRRQRFMRKAKKPAMIGGPIILAMVGAGIFGRNKNSSTQHTHVK
jgi:hypothetical protein